MNPGLKKLLADSQNAYKAMSAKQEDSALYRWLRKPVKESLLLDSMEDDTNFILMGPGTLSVSAEHSHFNKKSIKVMGPTALDVVPKHHRSYDKTMLVFDANGADWRKYNRISFWVYPDCPGFQNVWLSMTLNNDGKVKYPRPQYFEGTHHTNVKNGEWNQVIWEFPDVYRDKVASISINHNIHGSQQDMSDTATLYFSQLELQVVEADHYEGWELDDRIAFCHSGYRPDAEKIALTQEIEADTFTILSDRTGEIVFKGDVEIKETELGIYRYMDFTEFHTCGVYCLQIGDRKTKPFKIHETPWEDAVWKTINFFYQERCGMAVPGIHLPCHLDCFVEHPDGRRISVGGGWHDAGDLSQGLFNTAESVQAFLDMAASLKDSDPVLKERLQAEARWGLDWMMRTRFGDGYRCVWITIGLWTKNIVGDADDLITPARNSVFGNYCGAAAQAVGARMFREEDPVFFDYCLRCAMEDFGFAYERMFETNENPERKMMEVQLYGQGVVAAAELYKTTGDKAYLDKAAALAEVVMKCQQQEMPNWDIPIRGFFYESLQHLRPLTYDHRAHEQAPVVGLALLCELAPDHPNYIHWNKAITLYAEYIKSISQGIMPYGLLPSAIYEVDNSNLDNAPRDSTSNYIEYLQEDYNAQVKNGLRLSDKFYLRRFPVAFKFRGFFGVLMTKAKAAAITARVLKDAELEKIVQRQLEWIMGKNPFARSFMYGEGYDFPPQYSEFANDMVGELPVGIQTFENNDMPYMPMMNSATFKEIWVHSSSRFLWTIADVYNLNEII